MGRLDETVERPEPPRPDRPVGWDVTEWDELGPAGQRAVWDELGEAEPAEDRT